MTASESLSNLKLILYVRLPELHMLPSSTYLEIWHFLTHFFIPFKFLGLLNATIGLSPETFFIFSEAVSRETKTIW